MLTMAQIMDYIKRMHKITLAKFINTLIKLNMNTLEIERRMTDMGWIVRFSNDNGKVIRFIVDTQKDLTDSEVVEQEN